MELKWGDFVVDSADLPESTIDNFLARTFAHKMGNEVASKVKTWVDRYEAEHDDSPNDAEKAAAKHDFEREMFERICNGEIGQRAAAGPRADEFERTCRAVAEEFLRKALRAQKVKFPVKDETVLVAGKHYTRDALISARAEKDDVKAEARRRMDVAAEEVGVDILG